METEILFLIMFFFCYCVVGCTQRMSKKGLLKHIGLQMSKVTPRKKLILKKFLKHRRMLLKTCDKLKHCENALNILKGRKQDIMIESYNSRYFRSLIESSFRNCKKDAKGRRWTLDDKLLALSIYKRSPRTYSYLCHLLVLPSVRTLQALLHKLPMKTGINADVLSQLKKSVQKMKPRDRNCILMFDEIALQKRLIYNENSGTVEGFEDFGSQGRTGKLADHALVFMIQGLAKRYKQPVAFYLSNSTTKTMVLQNIIVEVIKSLQNVGFKVVATVCDQGATNRGAVQYLASKVEKNPGTYFMVNGERVYYLFDIPHLFKSLRNNFIGNLLKWNGKMARWSNIESLVALDKRLFRMHRLTNSHVQPKGKTRMKVKYAVQTLSQTTAACLRTLARCSEGVTVVGASETASVVDDLDKLFDMCNGPSSKKNRKPRRSNVTKVSNHLERWGSMKKKLAELSFIRPNGTTFHPPCQKGFVDTISSLQCITRHLFDDEGFSILNLRQLNQDPLENFFSLIRQHGITNHTPSCTHFIAAFKSIIVANFSAPHNRGGNCEDDGGDLLNDLRELLNDEVVPFHSDSTPSVSHVSCIGSLTPAESEQSILLHLPDSTDDDDVELEKKLARLEHQPHVYIAGYIGKQLLKSHGTCAVCSDSVCVVNPGPEHIYVKEKEWTEGCLVYASQSLTQTVLDAMDIFTTKIAPDLHYYNIYQLCKTHIMTCDTSWILCTAHRETMTEKLFSVLARFLIFTECKRRNEVMREAAQPLTNKRHIAKFTVLRSD